MEFSNPLDIRDLTQMRRHKISFYSGCPARQRGQALIYGLFIVTMGLVALFFLFNTAQLSSEKTKLINTADAVAYSTGVLHARALNFAAYTNRALLANEVLIAQMVSVSSWIEYAQGHVQGAPPLNCYTPQYSVPAVLVLVEYLPLCVALTWPQGQVAVDYAKHAIDGVGYSAVTASEVAKVNLQLAQATMFAAMLQPATKLKLMQEVADANYQNDGTVQVDIPLIDDFVLFEGGPFVSRYSGDERTRFRETELAAANLDEFIPQRSWSSRSPWPFCVPPRGAAVREGGTQLLGFDEWRAEDEASLSIKTLKIPLFGLPRCVTSKRYDLGAGDRSAKKGASSSSNWFYSGVPSFLELSKRALDRLPEDGDYGPTMKFSVRVVRSRQEARTSAGRSSIKPSGKLAIFDGKEAGGVMSAVATSEVFFERPEERSDGRQELPSLFNPYWQVHLVANSTAALAAAMAKQ